MIDVTAHLPSANHLFLQGTIALAEAELRGIPVNLSYLQTAIRETDMRVAQLREDFALTETGKYWKAKYPHNYNFDSGEQLGDILFNHMRLKTDKRTQAGNAAVDEEVIETLSIQFPELNLITEMRGLGKMSGTYLSGILAEAPDGVVHPQFDLHTTRTYRSSSSNPNFQNMPIRDPEQGALIRQAFVPPPGYQFVEADYSQLEVRVSACYHRDRKLIRYIKDPTTDMHRDTAMQLFRLPADIAAYKSIRHCAKNKAVFAEFYGSYFVNVARDIWREITKPKGLKLPDGTPLLKHLNSLGIRYLKPPQSGSLPPKGKDAASYECMVEGWERTFWDEWFVEYRDWKRDWFETYTKLGYFDSFTGFRYRGHFQRNDVVNYPIQGSAFHCNLRSFYRIHQELRRLQMKSYLVAQIHDSILALVKTEELKRYLELAREIMVNELARDWTWVVVPMDVEFEVAPPGESWHKKTKHKG